MINIEELREALSRSDRWIRHFHASKISGPNAKEYANIHKAAQLLADIWPELQEMIEARKGATEGYITQNDNNPYNDEYNDLLTSLCCSGDGRFKNDADCALFTTSANNLTKIIERIEG